MLQVMEIKKNFGATQVLKGVSFDLQQGQVLALIGSSGSGKTTLLRCLNGLETADSGLILVDGKPVQADNKQQDRSFGLVFQNFNLFPQYTALQNVMLSPLLQKKESREQIRCNALALLDRVGMKEHVDKYPWQLSGGQQQRVAIARALAMQPKILCFDEPTSALDPELTGEVLQVIRDLKRDGRTMIVVTHEMGFAKSVADVIIYMADGVIEEMGAPQEVFDAPKSEKLRAFLQGIEK